MGSGKGTTAHNRYEPLFETKLRKGRLLYRIFAASIFASICSVWVYRATQFPAAINGNGSRGKGIRYWWWIAMFLSELWFGFYWILTQCLRWSLNYRTTFKERLSKRYGDDELPKIDIFVCTADPFLEPPILVINTVLSVMAYDYPTNKLSVYLSDDGGSELTFYALLEASKFSKHWLPYCRKYNVEPRSPAAYFNSVPNTSDTSHGSAFKSIQRMYDGMEDRIETMMRLGKASDEVKAQQNGFSQWEPHSSKSNHDTILEILIDGRATSTDNEDVEGYPLPTLVYLAREKRPQHFHHFKAGAMNALIRVSSEISNGPIILNVDCDMYSNNSQSIRDALCFLIDEKQSQRIAFVQFPQKFKNVTKNDLYGATLRIISEVETQGLDSSGGPCYIGSGCFHRRDVLCGKKYTEDDRFEWKQQISRHNSVNFHHDQLEDKAKGLANCTYELKNTQWGKEMGVLYDCAVEDIITGLTIQCRGWRSAYCNPTEIPAFLGVAPTSLGETLIQHKRWSEGDLQIMLSKHCPLIYGHNIISLRHQLSYIHFCLWSINSFPTICYSVVPCLCLLNGITLFPKVSSPWFIPFGYIIIATNTYSLIEFLHSQGTILGWWNEQRIWLYKRISSYLFAFIDTFRKLLGFSDMKFVISSKVMSDEDASTRYEEEVMEFGSSCLPMFTILAILGLLNLLCLSVFVVVKMLGVRGEEMMTVLEEMGIQIVLCGVLVLINLPLYGAMFIRKDNGKLPSDVTLKSGFFVVFVCGCFSVLSQ